MMLTRAFIYNKLAADALHGFTSRTRNYYIAGFASCKLAGFEHCNLHKFPCLKNIIYFRYYLRRNSAFTDLKYRFDAVCKAS